MRLCIRRGANQIGGTCVEFEANGQRLVLDVGLPLDAEDSPDLLPDVPGLREPAPGLLGVLISHAHLDHYGLARYVRPDLPLLIGEHAEAILRAASPFLRLPFEPRHVIHLRHEIPIRLGPFEVIPYLVDHSAYDAYSFLIAAQGTRVFCSGDFRAHGRKQALFERLVATPPKEIDALLMEGSVLGRLAAAERFPSEQELEERFVSEMTATGGLCLVLAAAQNIDRVVTVYRACRRASRQLIVDLYAAEVLRATGNPNIPQGSWANVRVYLATLQRQWVRRNKRFDMVAPYRQHRIYPEALAREAPRSVLLFRPSMMADLEAVGCLSGARLLYSMWEGYLEEARFQALLTWLDGRGIPRVALHTSGHASVFDLRRLVAALCPGVVIPYHTCEPEQFRSLFTNAVVLRDGEWRSI
ncbi:MAG: MBL fold metallo-hydrolase [Candidatus Methylomirabilota bacterium]